MCLWGMGKYRLKNEMKRNVFRPSFLDVDEVIQTNRLPLLGEVDEGDLRNLLEVVLDLRIFYASCYGLF